MPAGEGKYYNDVLGPQVAKAVRAVLLKPENSRLYSAANARVPVSYHMQFIFDWTGHGFQ